MSRASRTMPLINEENVDDDKTGAWISAIEGGIVEHTGEEVVDCDEAINKPGFDHNIIVKVTEGLNCLRRPKVKIPKLSFDCLK